MTRPSQRLLIETLISEAVKQGARRARACALIGLHSRTIARWKQLSQAGVDRRVSGLRNGISPPNKLSAAEREQVLLTLNSEEFKDLPPSQVVPRLADKGLYLASESTMWRILRASGQLTHRRAERAPQHRSKPRALQATAPKQLVSWDITYLPTTVRGQYFYLYLFLDVFSRKVVNWQVFECESAELASQMVQQLCVQEGIRAHALTIHSDNGAPMKAETMLATLQRLGIAQSRSRPAVSNDNPYSESLFKTLKYRPRYPVKPFADLSTARKWVSALVDWYNNEHRHSAIGFVTPAQRHAGLDVELLCQRRTVYDAARLARPRRWTKSTRKWEYIHTVQLNPDRPTPVTAPANAAT
jgi:putative transposase